MNVLYRWYVTYSFNDGRKAGYGTLTMHASENWFPIRKATEWIKKDIKADSVIIQSWRRISEKQYEEFNQKDAASQEEKL